MAEEKKEFINNARELEVFKLSYRLSLKLHKFSLEFPKIEQFELASQIRRSSKSICANLVEGFSRQHNSKPEFRRFLTISVSSCDETLSIMAGLLQRPKLYDQRNF